MYYLKPILALDTTILSSTESCLLEWKYVFHASIMSVYRGLILKSLSWSWVPFFSAFARSTLRLQRCRFQDEIWTWTSPILGKVKNKCLCLTSILLYFLHQGAPMNNKCNKQIQFLCLQRHPMEFFYQMQTSFLRSYLCFSQLCPPQRLWRKDWIIPKGNTFCQSWAELLGFALE